MDLSAHTFTLDYPGGTPDSIREHPSTSSLRTWSDLATGRLSFAAYFERLANVDDLTCLTIDTTGACDLTCKGMCYYHPSIRITDREVPLHSATRAIEDAWKTLGMKTLVIAGKEPFLNPRRLFDLLEFAGRLPGRDFATHIVTNGRHIERNWDRLARVAEQGWLLKTT